MIRNEDSSRHVDESGQRNIEYNSALQTGGTARMNNLVQFDIRINQEKLAREEHSTKSVAGFLATLTSVIGGGLAFAESVRDPSSFTQTEVLLLWTMAATIAYAYRLVERNKANRAKINRSIYEAARRETMQQIAHDEMFEKLPRNPE